MTRETQLLILCHHDQPAAGPLLVSLRTVLADGRDFSESGREALSYQNVREPGALRQVIQWMRNHPEGILLFNGANCLTSSVSQIVLFLAAVRYRNRQVVHWHDSAATLRGVVGLEAGSRFARLVRRFRFVLVKHLLDNQRTWHLTLSTQGKQLVMFMLGAVPERVFVGGDAIDVGSCPVRDRSKRGEALRVCMAGVFEWGKGFDRFLDLAAQFREWKGRRVVFTWYGGTPEQIEAVLRGRWGERVRQSGVVLAGFQSPLVKALGTQDAFLLTSRNEAFGLVALEALACDLPVFCFDSVAMVEILDDAFVCSSPRAMLKKLADYLDHSEQYPPGYFRRIASRFDRDGHFLAAWNELMDGMEGARADDKGVG